MKIMKKTVLAAAALLAAAGTMATGCSQGSTDSGNAAPVELVKLVDEAEKTDNQGAEIPLLSMESPIDFSYGDWENDMVFEMEDGQWMDGFDSEIPINQERFSSMADGFLNLAAVSKETDGAEDLAVYGLDQPRYSLYITDNEKGDADILIGNQKDDGTYYLTLDERAVYTVNQSLVDSLIFDYNTLVVRESLDLTVAAGDVKSASVTGNGKTTKLKTSDQAAMADVAEGLSALKPDQYVSYHALSHELSSFGLMEDKRTTFTAVISQGGENRSVTVYVGNFADLEETLYYVQLGGSQMVCLADVEIIGKLINHVE